MIFSVLQHLPYHSLSLSSLCVAGATKACLCCKLTGERSGDKKRRQTKVMYGPLQNFNSTVSTQSSIIPILINCLYIYGLKGQCHEIFCFWFFS